MAKGKFKESFKLNNLQPKKNRNLTRGVILSANELISGQKQYILLYIWNESDPL